MIYSATFLLDISLMMAPWGRNILLNKSSVHQVVIRWSVWLLLI